MLVSLSWLKELVPIRMSVPELVERLDMTGTVVEGVETLGATFDGVVVGRILKKDRHPEADKLWVTLVDVGREEPLTIVCGAQNFDEGDRVPVALIGATLPNGITIKKAKLRGVASEGMNCSAAELGVGSDESGILVLPQDAPVGVPFGDYRGTAHTILELEITPNRPDCLSMVGMAREVATITEQESSVPASVPDEKGPEPAVSVTIDDAELCPRYTARLIRGVRIKPSPDWLAEKVIASGARPINNIVDITNYVMFELGQPLHAFDADLIGTDGSGKKAIGVRRARAGEKLRTLDGQDRDLTTDMLVITDPTGPVALAGVMGGESTEVHDGTVDILLESACFNPASISRTSRALGLVSEASMRFERGVDRAGCVAALERAAALMAELADGQVAPGVIDAYPMPLEPRTIELRPSRVAHVLGAEIATEDAQRILTSLGCSVSLNGGEALVVTTPSFRPDLLREIDLIEEIVRVWGMDRVEPTLPAGRGRIGGLTGEQRWRERVGAALRAVGLNETMTYSFTDPSDLDRLRWALPEGELPVELLNPMSSEQSVMRRTLLPGLLRAASYNQRRGNENVHLYEIGRVFWTSEGRKQPKERWIVGGLLSGAWHEDSWNEPARALDFFDAKGVVEAVMEELGIERWKVSPSERPWLQPGRRADVLVGGEAIGWVGDVHPLTLASFEAVAPTLAFEMDLKALIRNGVDVRPYREIPRYPAVTLDVALIVDDEVPAERVEQAITAAGGKLLESARLFDVYRGLGVPAGRKSMAFALSYRASDRTLTAQEVDAAHERLVRKVCGAVGAELRG